MIIKTYHDSIKYQVVYLQRNIFIYKVKFLFFFYFLAPAYLYIILCNIVLCPQLRFYFHLNLAYIKVIDTISSVFLITQIGYMPLFYCLY